MKEIHLTQNKIAIIDRSEYEKISQNKWRAFYNGWHWYAIRNVGKKPFRKTAYMHREIMNAPPDMQVDHINGNGLDNRRENLRLCTNSENQRNRCIGLDNTSGYKGVTWDKHAGKWKAQIKIGGRCVHIGLFNSPRNSALAYDKKAIELFGEFARTNFGGKR